MTRTAFLVRRRPSTNDIIVDETRGTGNHYYVHSGDGSASNDGLSPDTPMATIQQAINLCTASQGDRVWVMPGHAETISSAGGITADEVGITIEGLGNGANRPTITMSAVGSTIAVTAASVTFRNLRITCTAATTSIFNITAAGCTLDAVDYVEGSAIPLQFVLTTAAADQLTIRNCTHRAATAGASAQLWIQLVGVDDARIIDNTFYLVLFNGATTATINATTAVVRAFIQRNTFVQLGGTTQVSVVLLAATSTGIVTDNRSGTAFTANTATFACASAFAAENYNTNAVNTSGILDPVADT